MGSFCSACGSQRISRPSKAAPNKSQSDSSSNATQDQKPSLGTRIGQIAVGCAVAPIVGVALGCSVVRDALDAVWDGAEAIADKVADKVSDGANALGAKAESFIDAKSGVPPGDPNAKIVKGAAQVGYGLLRGGLAVSGVLGHGLAGFFARRHNTAMAAQIVKHGFQDAGDHIQKGAKVFKDALEERRKK